MPTHEELADKIDSLSDAFIGVLPITQIYCWYPARSTEDVAFLIGMNEQNKAMRDEERAARGQELMSSLQPALFRVAKPVPLNTEHTVFAIFQGENEVRVYATSDKAYTRYRLHKSSPVFGVELMHEETFCQEIAEEWDALAGIEPDDDQTETPEEPKSKPVLSAVPSPG